MGKLDQHAAPPIAETASDGSDQLCPECEHGREAHKESWIDRLALRLGFAPPPAQCQWSAEVMADPCGCTNHFHGS